MYTLLLVDDEARIREGIGNYVPWDMMGFQVAAIRANGREALDYLAQNEVDAILCDIRMPEMDGIALAQALWEKKCKAKIVFLTGYADFEYTQSAIKYGARNYILKPTSFQELYRVFTELRAELDEDRCPGADAAGVSGTLVGVMLDYTHKHLSDATLAQAAFTASISPGHASRIFKKEMRVSFSDYLLHMRMKEAARMVRDGRKKMYEIALLLGYDNPKNFTRAFKQHFGCSPREYREGGLE